MRAVWYVGSVLDHGVCSWYMSRFSSVQFSPLTDWVLGGHAGRFSKDPLPVFSAGGPRRQFWHGQGCPLFDVVHPAFTLSTTASPTLKDALKESRLKNPSQLLEPVKDDTV